VKQITLSVGEFALPVPRVGSIESNSGYGRGSADGLLIHQAVQAQKKEVDDKYLAEVKISGTFTKGEFEFTVGGRIDGMYDGKVPKIEEIKSSFDIQKLKRKLNAEQDTHPYCLQLKTYGYLHWKLTGIKPDICLYLVSSRNRKAETLNLVLDIDDYENWLELRLAELVVEAERNEVLVRRRKKWAKEFEFPFPNPRTGQMELVAEIEKGIQTSTRMLIQAPTGLGKTAGVLYPMLKESLSRGQNTIYVTPKNSQHSVAEDAIDKFKEQGIPVRSLTLTAKSKICFKNEPLCNPEYCEFAKNHYTKVAENGLSEELARKRKLGAKTFKKLGQTFEVCPFELQFEAAKEADVVIGDYNYVFSPRSSVARLGGGTSPEGKPNLVIDEAHNLFARALGYYSPEVSTQTLEKMRESVEFIPRRFQDEVDNLISECQTTIRLCRPEGITKPELIEPPIDAFMEQDSAVRAFLSRYLESDVEIQPRDVVLRLSYYWSEFTAALEFVTEPKRPEFFTTFRPGPAEGGSLRITCCDASEFIRGCYDEFGQVVGFSATLKPFDYYAKLSGLNPTEIKVSEFQSPFAKSQRKVLIIPEISTKYSNREKNYDKVAAVIERISAVKPGNYFAFFPSFEFLEKVKERFKIPPGFMTLSQTRYMKAADVDGFIHHLREKIVPTIIFAVQGGVFSEGVDYPGDMLIGAFVIGPALPSFDLEREQMRAYYQDNYGEGFHYAYSYPAMSKAVQAAGRVVRSETDRGIIVLMDNRFLEPNYARSMPADWFSDNPRELVSRAILKEVSDFWSQS
jgi:DNA excision repair protein ERCC-2